MNEMRFSIFPIGTVRRSENCAFIELFEPYRPALKQLDHFSHVIVLWWANQHDNKQSRTRLQTKPPYAQGVVTGVFATRAEYRPNPIAVTTCKLLSVDEEIGTIQVANIDAFDGTPVLDLKAYFQVCDRVEMATIPEWLSGWPAWMPEDGLGL
jgi:tRNA-Thr(GGU) m(6)t(6)A37 methyltransferase TsaA